MLKTKSISHQGFGILFCGAMRQKWNFCGLWISGMSGGRRMKRRLKRTRPASSEACGGSVTLWGCSAASGTGDLQRVEGTMESVKHQGILGKNVMPSVMKPKLGRHRTFQQVNDPRHTSKSTKARFQKKKWKILEWPSQSPDLSPIGNLWWDLKKAVSKRTPKNMTELEAIAHEQWAQIPQERCQQLVSGSASRLQQVMTATGCSTKC